MSKLSFRARALDASKPLPVFRCEDLPDLHEYASINRAVPQMPTGMEKEEESVCFRSSSVAARPTAAPFSRPCFPHRGAPRCCLRKLVQNGRHYLYPFFFLPLTRRLSANTAFREPAPPREPPRGRAGTISDALAVLCPVGWTRNRAREHKAESRDSRRLHHFVDFLLWVEGKRERASDAVHLPRASARGRQRAPTRLPPTHPHPQPGLTARCCVLTAPASPCVLHTGCSCSRQVCQRRRRRTIAFPVLF